MRKTPSDIGTYLSSIGRKGGSKRSAKKRAAVLRNLERALEARWKKKYALERPPRP